MANPILRLGIYILVGSLLASWSPAQVPKPRTVTAQTAETRTVTGKIVLTEENGQLVPAEKPDLGVVQAGERLKVEFNVVNGTQNDLVFDRIASNVGQAQPDKGRIRPGESIKVSFRTQMSSRPRSQTAGNFIEFHCNDGKKGFIFYAYAFSTYVGVAEDFLRIPLQDHDPISQARFDVPIVIGGKLKDGDFEVSLDGIDGEFEARIDPLAKKLHCLVKFEEPLEADRRQGQLVILDLASGFIRETPIVFEREKKLASDPGHLSLVQRESLTSRFG
jgi:hypothetical protein